MPDGQIDAALLEQIKERTPRLPLISSKVPLKRLATGLKQRARL